MSDISYTSIIYNATPNFNPVMQQNNNKGNIAVASTATK